MPAFEWVHVQLHQQKGMISLSPPTICNSARFRSIGSQTPLLSDALDSVPDEEIGSHLFWLSEKLGRTPFSVAFQIAAIKELQDGWEEQFREISDNIRLSGLSISDYLKQNGTDLNA
ncbi:transposase [Klebsiella pneumoniae]|nr:transposase [Klebsiella pneumoniae]